VLLTVGLHLRGSSLPSWCGWGEARRLDLAPRRGSRGVMILRPLRWEWDHVGYLRHRCELLRQDSRPLLQVLGDARRAADLIAPEAVSPSPDAGEVRLRVGC